MITQMIGVDPTSQRLGQRVRDERRGQGMDQRTLAMVANVAVRSIHRVEHGEPTVRLDVITRILAALGLRLNVQGRNDTEPKSKPQGPWTPEEIAREERAARARDTHDRKKSPEERLEETVRVSRFMSELADGTPSDVRT